MQLTQIKRMENGLDSCVMIGREVPYRTAIVCSIPTPLERLAEGLSQVI